MGRDDLERASRDERIDLVLSAPTEKQATQSRLEEAEQQLRGFKQQPFGAKSERRVEVDPSQLSLGEGPATPSEEVPSGRPVREQTRRPRREKEAAGDSGLSFDESVPVERVVVSDPALEGLSEGVDYTVISEKKSYRPAPQPASYTVLEIVRPVVKLAETGELAAAVIPGSYADGSLLAGLLVDRFKDRLPLYRQHQRLAPAGITVSRESLTSWVQRAAMRLEPVYNAPLRSILSGSLVARERRRSERAAARTRGRRPTSGHSTGIATRWPFPFAPTRAHRYVEEFLGGFQGTLLTDGYAV